MDFSPRAILSTTGPLREARKPERFRMDFELWRLPTTFSPKRFLDNFLFNDFLILGGPKNRPPGVFLDET